MATHLSIVEAVETLSNIADLEFDRDVGIAQKHEVVLGEEHISYKTVHWLHKEDATATVQLVCETFRMILHYLRQFYKKEYGQVGDQETVEGIKAIMVLVGEAAKKLDRYTQLFHLTQSVTDFKEYRQLQEFYRTKIARKIDEGALNKWLLGFSLGKKLPPKESLVAVPAQLKAVDTKRIFVDLETVKRDTEYELFFIRKEDGSHFFSPRLLRNIKLVHDFGGYFGEKKGMDPLGSIKQWQDRVFHTCAREILKSVGSRLDHFFKDIRQTQGHELVNILNKALIALLMSSHAQNLLHHQPIKSCAEYFVDFQGFLREALQTTIYQRWMTHPPKEGNQLAFDLLDLIYALCRALYVNVQGLEEVMTPVVQGLIQEAKSLVTRERTEETHPSHLLWSRLAGDDAALSKLLKRHANGPLLKVIEILEEDTFHIFDPLLQHNVPNQLFDLYVNDQRYLFLRIPAPITQEFINKAFVNEEFKAFIRSYAQQAVPHRHLLINLQDRTSWREYARCIALEELQQQPDMRQAISVVTLTTDTDFYHQLSPYHQVNHASTFMEQFKELLLDENAGYFFPTTVNRDELSTFIDGAFHAIHRIFFSGKNVLLRESRLDFIEIFYLLLQLKLMEWIQPDSISLMSKDSIDTGEDYAVGLFVLLKLITDQKWKEEDWQHVHMMLYGPALLIRERVMLPERFNRLLSALKAVENAKEEHGRKDFVKMMQKEFSKLFKMDLLTPQLLPR